MLAIYLLLATAPEGVTASLLRIAMPPVVRSAGPESLGDLEQYTQLVLSDLLDTGKASHGLASTRRWRLVDLGRRMDFLPAGSGWCRMPEPLVADAIAAGRLIRLAIADDIAAAHGRDRVLGPGGRRLLDKLVRRLNHPREG